MSGPMLPIGSQVNSPSPPSGDSRLEMAIATIIGLGIIIGAKVALIYFLFWLLSVVT